MVPFTATALASGLAVSQCAEAITIARGRPICAPKPRRKSRAGQSSNGKVGAPWETKSDGSITSSWARPGWIATSNHRQGRRQSPADPHRLDAGGEAIRARLHEHAAKRGGAIGRREALAGQFAGETLQRLAFFHPDHGIIIGTGARIALIGGAAGQYL